jgi:hypothetical protein
MSGADGTKVVGAIHAASARAKMKWKSSFLIGKLACSSRAYTPAGI